MGKFWTETQEAGYQTGYRNAAHDLGISADYALARAARLANGNEPDPTGAWDRAWSQGYQQAACDWMRRSGSQRRA